MEKIKSKNIPKYLFIIWVLSFPFYRINIIYTYSIDNILAPILILMFFYNWLAKKEVFTPFKSFFPQYCAPKIDADPVIAIKSHCKI